MLTGLSAHRAKRIFTETAFQVADRIHERTDERQKIGLGEYTEEWHVDAVGQVNNNVDFVQGEIELGFSMDFFTAPEQRRSDLTMPTFTFGSFQSTADTGMIVVTATVREWVIRPDGAFTGAFVRVGMFKPDADGETPFDMLVHLVFSGWGAPNDAEVGEPDLAPTPP